MFGGGAKAVGFDAMFGECLASTRLFVDERLHDNGDERHHAVVMGAIKVSVC